ncbi:glycosyltransferase family 4 protein [Fulvivirga sedimenti]|uniref:Glycosyltransferase family 4 protein n=1 Tax=Fulvivirga sedimenti TaxID=2879465 RepID=A0A9X1L165_9BACT|nr:glycosyltransferase family 4 protein [Fulvivirga sedimenti]MCA6078619.1 glycosyltransferase family 4 protein [Fulvivirga sedimenti]
MHIRIIHQYFRTPDKGGGLRSYYIARELLDKGYRVSVITATNENKAHFENIGGIEVHYIPVYYTNHLSFYSRLHAFLRYVFLCVRKIRSLERADLNYVITTPLTTGVIAIYEKFRRKTPYIFEVGDLWPDAPIQLNVLKNPILKWLARGLEQRSYQGASALIGLSPPISDYLRNCKPSKTVLTITNFSNVQVRRNTKDPVLFRKELGIAPEAFLIAYAGTIGMANHLEYLVDFINTIPLDWPVHAVVMGDGARLPQIRAYAGGNGRITFLEKGGQQQVADLLTASNAVYISFYNVPVLNTGSPNKFFDAIAAGKLVILNFKGWLKSLVESENIGFYQDPGNPSLALDKLKEYIDNPEEFEGVGGRGMRMAETRYTPQIQLQPLIKLLQEIKKS